MSSTVPAVTTATFPSEVVNASALQANSHAERVSRALINAVASNAVGDNGCLFRGMGRSGR